MENIFSLKTFLRDKCGEPTFSRETTERVRQMVHGEAQPVRTLEMDVFSFGS